MPPRFLPTCGLLAALLVFSRAALAQEAKVVEREGRVVVTKVGARPVPATVGLSLVARDRLGTGEASRAVLRMGDRWFARVDEETDVEITPGALGAKDKDALKVALGGAFIYSREEEGELKVQTPSATGGLRGTQLFVRVDASGKTWMQVLEGEVELANEFGRVQLRAGEAGEAGPGQAPRKTAVIETRSLVQWALYYPAVLLPEDAGLDAAESRILADALSRYAQGDLPGALEHFPAGDAAPRSAAVRLFRAAVLLAAGRVDSARRQLEEVPPESAGRRALERLVAAVLGRDVPAAGELTTASLALAESYLQQSRHQLPAALAAARRATELGPRSGFTWVRLAELEFSFGRGREARQALERGLALAPRHAQAHTLRGFLHSADNRIDAARGAFEQALQIDGALGSAWLGLGLTKIRQNRIAEGRADLQMAAVVEPTRASFYSYHGKALNADGRPALAWKDLLLAKQLDPADPTPWLYSALQLQQENRPNAAIAELQESLRRNDQRRVYRSQFLLDQDRAVRSANLAQAFQHDGMPELAVREAARAVESDYGNASAHLFLAHSFDALRDPNRISLRFETAWFNELLLASLLSPVGGGALSQFVSQQEYSKLLEADRPGGSLLSQWRSDGRFDAAASVATTSGRLSLGADVAYARSRGSRPNQDATTTEGFLQAKYQVSPDDVLYTLANWNRQSGGDLAENHANTPGNPGLRFTERQRPGLLLAGWNRTWAPGVTTLFVGGRLAADQTLTAPNTTQTLLGRSIAFLQPGFLTTGPGGALVYASPALAAGPPPVVSLSSSPTLRFSPEFLRAIAPYLGQAPVTATFSDTFDFSTRRDLVIHSGELQQLWHFDRTTLLAGARWQAGDFDSTARLDLRNAATSRFFASPASEQQLTAEFARRSAYAYAFRDVAAWLRLIGGVSWDRIKRPENFRNPPLLGGEREVENTHAKIGFTATPLPNTTIRGAYTEATGGVTFDESVRLEPVQLAGFNQTFRTVISESLVGSVETPAYKQWGLGVDGHVSPRTWWSAAHQDLREKVRRTVGAFDAFTAPIFPTGAVILPASTTEALDYREEISSVGVNHLIGASFALGLNLQRTQAELRRRFPQVPVAVDPQADRTDRATLDAIAFTGNWNAPGGWFARGAARWLSQSLTATAAGRAAPVPAGDRFWQFDLLAGRRFQGNRCDVSAGLLNLTDRDYRLSPLTYQPALARERTLVVRLRVGF